MKPPPPPRKPGSQVAPGQRPLFTDGRTASTHSKIPIDQATAGRLYRVRDKHLEDVPGTVWGDNLSWDDASKLKDLVVAQRKSKTARVEDMEVPMPADEPTEDLAILENVSEQGETSRAVRSRVIDPAITAAQAGQGAAFELVGDEAHLVPSRGVVVAVPAGHELLVDGEVSPVPSVVSPGAVVQARAIDPAIAAAQAAARAAVRPVAASAQARHAAAYRDKTVSTAGRRTQPPPRDRTVSKSPAFVRLGAPPAAPAAPPMSPLKVATETDGEALPEGALSDADLHDLDVGGGPSEDDVAHAKRLRDARG
jgi:hypothetical protein